MALRDGSLWVVIQVEPTGMEPVPSQQRAQGTQVSIVDDRAGPPQKYLDFDLPAYTVLRIKYLLVGH